MTSDESDSTDESSLIRPYVMTGGETRATASDLPLETVVTVSEGVEFDDLGFERHDIATLCTKPTSIAELASRLDMPLGVARFLVSEMAAGGVLHTHETASANDPELLEKLIEGIKAL